LSPNGWNGKSNENYVYGPDTTDNATKYFTLQSARGSPLYENFVEAFRARPGSYLTAEGIRKKRLTISFFS